jgi:hypothetical protein
MPLRPYLIYKQTFIIAIIPLRDVFREHDFIIVVQRYTGILKKALKRLLCTFARRNPYFSDAGWVDDLAGAYELSARTGDLLESPSESN